MEEKPRCEICDRNFKDAEGLDMHNAAKHPKTEKTEKKKIPVKKIRNWGIGLIITVLVVWGISAMFSGGGLTLPPTDMQGHVEVSPDSHVLKEPMNILIQKHMLEHADGTGSPGVVINYDCENYDCETGLIENLEAFADTYPENVYVAPFKNMAAKMALTKLNRIETLDEYDKNKIHIFISGRIPINEELGISNSENSEENQILEELTQTTNIKEFNMVASQWKFSPDTIRVNKGDNVILNVESVDVAHGIAIPDYGIDEYLSPGQTVKIEFVADRKGTFLFSCSVSCGVGHLGMSGKLIVE